MYKEDLLINTVESQESIKTDNRPQIVKSRESRVLQEDIRPQIVGSRESFNIDHRTLMKEYRNLKVAATQEERSMTVPYKISK